MAAGHSPPPYPSSPLGLTMTDPPASLWDAWIPWKRDRDTLDRWWTLARGSATEGPAGKEDDM